MSTQRTWHRHWPVLVLVLVAGCSRGGLTKVVVSGNVSYNGQPVKNGEILFYPVGDTQGPVSGASIKDGHYEAVGKRGVPIGTHRVVIRGFRAAKVANKAAAQAALAMEGESGTREQYLPAKFNEKSTLEVKISADQRRTEKDFSLSD